jgi:hypothetical protein
VYIELRMGRCIQRILQLLFVILHPRFFDILVRWKVNVQIRVFAFLIISGIQNKTCRITSIVALSY